MKAKTDTNNKETFEPLPAVALREQIERRAYHLWLTGGGRHGEDLRHWLQAESEVMKALSQDQAERRASSRNTSAKPKLRASPAPNETISKE